MLLTCFPGTRSFSFSDTTNTIQVSPAQVPTLPAPLASCQLRHNAPHLPAGCSPQLWQAPALPVVAGCSQLAAMSSPHFTKLPPDLSTG